MPSPGDQPRWRRPSSVAAASAHAVLGHPAAGHRLPGDRGEAGRHRGGDLERLPYLVGDHGRLGQLGQDVLGVHRRRLVARHQPGNHLATPVEQLAVRAGQPVRGGAQEPTGPVTRQLPTSAIGPVTGPAVWSGPPSARPTRRATSSRETTATIRIPAVTLGPRVAFRLTPDARGGLAVEAGGADRGTELLPRQQPSHTIRPPRPRADAHPGLPQRRDHLPTRVGWCVADALLCFPGGSASRPDSGRRVLPMRKQSKRSAPLTSGLPCSASREEAPRVRTADARCLQ